MQEIMLGPKTVLVVGVLGLNPTILERAKAHILPTLAAAGIDIPDERVLFVDRDVEFATIDQVTEQDLFGSPIPVEIADDETDDPDGGPLSWNYVRAAEEELARMQREVERWKLVASGGHGKLRLDGRLDSLSIKLNGLAVKMVGEASKSAFDICSDLQAIAAFLRSHLDGPQMVKPTPVHVGVDLASGPDKSAEWTPPPLNESHKKGGG